jgi:transcriptional regulator with XRE-family HTH domain
MISTKLNIGGNLHKIRVAKKHTQTALAKAIGINQSNYCDIEGNRTMPTIPTLQKLAEFLEVPLVKLFEEKENTIINNHTNNIATLNGTISGDNTNNFFENKEIVEKLQNTLKEAFASAMATEIEKLTKTA